MRRNLTSHTDTQAMRKKAAIVLLEEIWIPRGSKFRVQRDFRRKYPEYECYIAAGSDIDLVADTDGDQVPSDLILVAFITGNSSLEPLIEGLYAQIHVNLR